MEPIKEEVAKSDMSIAEEDQTYSSLAMKRTPTKTISGIKERLTMGAIRSLKRHSLSDTVLMKPSRRSSVRLRSTVKTRRAISLTCVPHTKWSRKLFGSEKAVQDEHQKVINAGNFVIHPFSNFRFVWDVISAFIIIVNIIIIPMDLAFARDRTDFGSMTFKVLSDFWFIVDIALNFYTGIPKERHDMTAIVFDLKDIRAKYMKTWFLVDLIASFPLDFVMSMFVADINTTRATRFLRTVKILSLVKVARLPRLVRGLHRWEEILNLQYDMAVSFLRLAYLVFIIFMACHWNGCLLYMVPMLYEFPEETWVYMRGLHHSNVTWLEAYSWSLFKSTSHMLCIGFSIVIPRGLIDLWTTLVSQISGAVLFGVFIGNAINLIEEMDAAKHAYRVKVSEVQEYLAFRRIPINLRRRVMTYFDVRYGGKMFDEQQILSELSPCLRREVILHNCADLINSVPLFEDVDEDFVAEIGANLTFSVFTPDEIVVKEGDVALSMFLVLRGELFISAEDGTYKRQCSDGMFFGESCILHQGLRRAATVKAVTNVQLYSLHQNDFNKVGDAFPKQKEKVEERFQKLAERTSQYDFVKDCISDSNQTS